MAFALTLLVAMLGVVFFARACAVKKLVQALRTALLKPTQVRNTLVHEVTDYHSVPHAKSVSVQELFEEGSKKIADVARLLDELEKEVGFSAGCWLKSVQKGIHTLKQKNVLEVFEDFERLQAVDDGKPVHIPFQKCGNDLVNEKVKAVERFFFPVKSGSPTGNGVHVQVLTGMFGIGKSTTASSYAWRCVNDKRCVRPVNELLLYCLTSYESTDIILVNKSLWSEQS